MTSYGMDEWYLIIYVTHTVGSKKYTVYRISKYQNDNIFTGHQEKGSSFADDTGQKDIKTL